MAGMDSWAISIELIVVFLVFLVFALPGMIGGSVASRNGRNYYFWAIVCLMFPPAVIATFFLKPANEVEGRYRQCPYCKEFIKWEATVCKHCKKEIEERSIVQ